GGLVASDGRHDAAGREVTPAMPRHVPATANPRFHSRSRGRQGTSRQAGGKRTQSRRMASAGTGLFRSFPLPAYTRHQPAPVPAQGANQARQNNKNTMQTLGYTSAPALLMYLRHADALGLDLAAARAAAGITPEDLADSGRR